MRDLSKTQKKQVTMRAWCMNYWSINKHEDIMYKLLPEQKDTWGHYG